MAAKSKEVIQSFELGFRKLCETHDMTAVFVLISGHDEKGSILSTGGCAELCDFVDRSLFEHLVEAAEKKH